MNIFIAGTYGVGKTFICDKLSYVLSIPHFSSSQIIKHGEIQKSVADVSLNQQKLISGLSVINNEYPSILLDGHFCILSKNGMSIVGADTFSALNLKVVVLLVQDPKVILKRLVGRKGEVFDLATIQGFQEMEISQARRVSEELSLPIIEVLSEEKYIPSIIEFIEEIQPI
jgi:adenylate kinase